MINPARLRTLLDPRAALAALALSLAPNGVQAQVPPGWAVASSFDLGNASPGGLTLIHSADPLAPPVPITGLPVEITGPSPTNPGSFYGANSVLVDASGTRLVVGEVGQTGQRRSLHVVTLSGSHAVAVKSYPIDTPTGGGGGVDQMAWLGPDIVFSVRGRAYRTGPFANQYIGILRPDLGPPGTPGTVTVVPMTVQPSGTINALAVDADAGLAYFGVFVTVTTSQIWSVPVPGSGQPVAPSFVVNVNGTVSGLQFHKGNLLFSGWTDSNFSAPYLASIDVASPVPTVTSLPVGNVRSLNALCVDPVTDELLLVDDFVGRLYRYDFTNNPQQLGSVASGVASGVAMLPALAVYGSRPPSALAYEWQIGPNAGGLPLVGNQAFGISLGSSLGAAPGVLVLSLQSADIQVPGLDFRLLIDPAGILQSFALPAQPRIDVPLPIPNDPNLRGVSLFGQALMLESSAPAPTSGVRISLF